MILLFGSLNDEVTAYLTLRMLERQARFIQIEPADHQQGFELDWGIANGKLHGELRHGELRIALDVRDEVEHLRRAMGNPALAGKPRHRR